MSDKEIPNTAETVRMMITRLLLWFLAIGALIGAMLLAGTPKAHADIIELDNGNTCQSDLWITFGSTRRIICDGPIRPDQSWERARVLYTPAHTVPVTCYGRYYVSCSGGYWVDITYKSKESYIVFPSNVLPDEPGHLG